MADFDTLAEALDYAAGCESGYNFYDARGNLREVLPYRELRRRAQALARRLLGDLELARGDRVAMVADTEPAFPILFFACRYAGLIPVALPISINLGGHAAYVRQLRGLLESCGAALAVASAEFLPFLQEAASGLAVRVSPPEALEALPLPETDTPLPDIGPDEVAYLQFTSGSTRFPRGVVIRERAVMSNLRGIVRHGLAVRPGDRCASWLPLYHDMGLVGFMLGPMVSQLSADYLRTRDFAVRPLQWLNLISRNRCTIAFAPPFGYDLCARRLRATDIERLDLSCWRIAGIGAEMIRHAPLERFAELLRPAGFDPRAFLPCYGLAEASLAVTFAPIGRGVEVVRLDADQMAERSEVVHAVVGTRQVSEVVYCGYVLPDHRVVIRDDAGRPLPDGHIGRIAVSGPSIMSGYFENPEATREALDPQGWLDTGDLGCVTADGLLVTGRRKDLIIVNGRNIWPQDIEHLVEDQPEVRVGDASVFAVTAPDDGERVVLVLQCRLSDEAERQTLVARIQQLIHVHFGVHCHIELVPPHTLPRTSSGKPSRAAARLDFLARSGWGKARQTGGESREKPANAA